jgi:hypothetical protein
MIAGLVAISVGDEFVIRHPAGHIRPAWIAVILGGPALFLAGRAIFQYVLFSHVSKNRAIGVLALAAGSPSPRRAAGVDGLRLGARQQDAVHDAALTLVVVHGEVPGLAVIPHGDRARGPVESRHELRARAVREQVLQQR